MKQYSDTLLLEFLMFSDDINQEIKDFEYSLTSIDPDDIEKIILDLAKENIYTEKNLENLKKIITFLKPQLKSYDFLIHELDSVKPSYDIYYYEYLEKYEVLKRNMNMDPISIPVSFLEKSIRFDFYAFKALTSEPKEYIENYFGYLVNNPLFLLFVNKILNENPDVLLNKTILKRICGIIELNMASLENSEMIEYHQKLLKKIKYFSENKKAEVFDYELFLYYQNKALFEYLMTSDVSLHEFHDVVISEPFLGFLEEYISKYDGENSELFLYNHDMTNRLKYIISYILNVREDNNTKIRCNILLQKWMSHKIEDEMLFYKTESIERCSFREIVLYNRYPQLLVEEMQFLLHMDYYIFEIYALDDEHFEQMISNINCTDFSNWMKKMMKVNSNFFRNDILRERTYQIIDQFSFKENNEKEIEKMKRKMKKMNKGLV